MPTIAFLLLTAKNDIMFRLGSGVGVTNKLVVWQHTEVLNRVHLRFKHLGAESICIHAWTEINDERACGPSGSYRRKPVAGEPRQVAGPQEVCPHSMHYMLLNILCDFYVLRPCAVCQRHQPSRETCLYHSQVVPDPISIPFEHLSG